MPSRQPIMCRPWGDHQPDRHYGPIKQYFLFQAARDGCKACVHHFLTAEEIPLLSRSHRMHYTVLDYALHATKNHTPGAEAVVTYLQKCWPCITPSQVSPQEQIPSLLQEDASASALDTSPLQRNPSASVFANME